MSAPGTQRPVWKHQTTTNAYIEKREIHFFDDEKPGFVTVYISDGKDRFPARDVAMEPRARLEEILRSWVSDVPFVDHCKDAGIGRLLMAVPAARYDSIVDVITALEKRGQLGSDFASKLRSLSSAGMPGVAAAKIRGLYALHSQGSEQFYTLTEMPESGHKEDEVAIKP